ALALTGKVQRCTGRRCEIVRSRQEIGVDVRFRHVRDADAIRPGSAGAQADVGIGIDDDRLASFFAGDEITRLRQILVVKSSEKHRRFQDPSESVARRVDSSYRPTYPVDDVPRNIPTT